ncbi:MAG: hypothetical protein J6P74_07215 [Paludibacteraceae bacterium]|nr:hypothetical protein [Paludibacteraceae bacterium]
MKKLFTFIAALVACVAINATKIVLDPASMPQMTTAGAYDQTVEGIHVQITKGIVNTSEMRIYKNETITLTAESPISAIVFTCTASGTTQYGPGCFEEQAGYTYDKNKGTWDGSSNSVAFKASSNQVRASQIEVYLNGEKPSSEVVPLDTIGVSDAIARIKAGNKGECFVKGVVAGDPFLLGANGPAFYLTDIANPSDSLEGFKIGKDANTLYQSVEEMSQDIAMGDTILIYAIGLAKYNNIYETTGGYYFRTIGKSSSTILTWNFGTAIRFEDHWQLEIAKADGDEENVLIIKFASDKENAIGGLHYMAPGSSISINGSNSAVTSGTVQLTFKEVAPTTYNVYDAKIKAATDDDIYTISGTIEFYAVNEEYDEIDLDGDRPFVPTEGQEITCEQARSYALSLPTGATGDITVTVHGFVTDLFNNGITFWMADKQGSDKVFQAYLSVLPAGVALANGAEVKVTGKITNYNGTPEINKGNVEVISGGEELVGEETVDVAGALAVAQALEPNKTTTKVYDIIGFVSEIVYPYAEDKGITFWMSDNATDGAQTFEAYQVQCKPEVAAKIEVGVKVKVTARITHFHQDAKPATDTEEAKPERTVYETAKGGIVKFLSGAGVEVITNDAVAVKFIENGQLYIIRGNAQYNVQGQLVK